MYKYLLFDLDDTLLDFKKAEKTALRRVLKKFSIDDSDRTVDLYSAINDSFWKRFEKGEITRADIFEGRFIELSKALNLDFDTAAVSVEYFNELSFCGLCFPYTHILLEKLCKKGYILAAVTNGSLLPQTGRIKASGIAGYFKGGIHISEVIGYQKPQKEYFNAVLDALGNPPKNEILLLGDSLSSDIKGAIAMGLDNCFVNLRGQSLPPDIKPTYTVTSLEEIISVCRL